MGTSFTYIADGILEPSGLGNCQHCGRDGVASYAYREEIIDPALASDPDLAREEKEINAACIDCTNGGNIQKSPGEIWRMAEIIERCNGDVATLVERYNQIPSIPMLLQDDDWPICCGDWCEYYGTLERKDESVAVTNQHRLWRFGPTDEDTLDVSAVEIDGYLPDFLADTCLFRCQKCGIGYCVFQPT